MLYDVHSFRNMKLVEFGISNKVENHWFRGNTIWKSKTANFQFLCFFSKISICALQFHYFLYSWPWPWLNDDVGCCSYVRTGDTTEWSLVEMQLNLQADFNKLLAFNIHTFNTAGMVRQNSFLLCRNAKLKNRGFPFCFCWSFLTYH